MMTIEILDREIQIPQSLNEMTRKQITYLAELLLAELSAESISLLMYNLFTIKSQPMWFQWLIKWELKIKPWWISTRLGRFVHEKLDVDIRLYNAQHYKNVEVIFEATKFLFDKDDTLNTEKISLKAWNSKILKLKQQGPGDYGINLSFGQFWNTEIAFLRYQSEPTAHHYYAFFECLYQLASSQKATLTAPEREVIIWYWAGVREGIFSEFPFVFPKRKGKPAKELDLEAYEENWLDVLDSIAEKPTAYESTNNLPARYVLRHINKKIREAKELEEQLKQKK
jgi:hypothetical protein